jgi:Protein of unknown function (DUF998)
MRSLQQLTPPWGHSRGWPKTRTDYGQLVTAIPLAAARVAFAGGAAFVLLLAALHFIRPDLDPSWHFVSDYAIGDYGWMMAVAFLALALSYVALFVTLRLQVETLAGRIGLALLLVSAVGLILGGLFTTDPLLASPEARTASGKLHSVGGTLGIVIPFAAALISWSLARSRGWSLARVPLLWSAGLAVLGFLVSAGSLTILLSQSGGTFGPEVPVGWPNRLEIMAYTLWPMVVAWCAVRLRKGMLP